MATKVSLYNDKWIEQITYQKSLEEYGESNTKLINNLKNILKCAIKNELTEKQKIYYSYITMMNITWNRLHKNIQLINLQYAAIFITL